jgi:hypothetical protein
MDGRINASLLHKSHECELSWLNLSNNWVQTMLLQWHGYGQVPRQSDLDFHRVYILSIQTPSDAVDGPAYFIKAWMWAELADSQ